MSAEAESSVDNLATSFGMDDPAQETRIVRQLKREANARVIDQFGGLDLAQVCHTIFAVGSNGLTYFVKWEDCKDAILPGRRCIRIAVWRLYAPPGLGRHIGPTGAQSGPVHTGVYGMAAGNARSGSQARTGLAGDHQSTVRLSGGQRHDHTLSARPQSRNRVAAQFDDVPSVIP